MNYQVGQTVYLLKNMSFKGGAKAQPVGTAEILSYNQTSALYKLKYTVNGTGETGEIKVTTDRFNR